MTLRDLMCRRCARWTRNDGDDWFHIDDGTIACVDPITLQPNTPREAPEMTTTRDAKGKLTPKARTKPVEQPKLERRRRRAAALPVLDELMSPIVGKGKSKAKPEPKRKPRRDASADALNAARKRGGPIVKTEAVVVDDTKPRAVNPSVFATLVAQNLNATDEATIPLPPDDEIMATDVAMLMSIIWKAHKATGGTVVNQPDIINRYNQWKRDGRIMATATATRRKSNNNGERAPRALVDNAASDATITKMVKKELAADPTFTAWSRIVRAIRANGEAVSRVRVETILDAERKTMPKGATKATPSPASAARAKAATKNAAVKANPTGKAARKATTKAARAAKESSPVAPKRSSKPIKRVTKKVGRR